MSIQFVDIGFSNYVEANKILTVNRPDGAPIKRVISQAKERGTFLDLTQGKKTRSIITQMGADGIVITASAVQTATIIDRIKRSQNAQDVIQKISGDVVETTVQE